MLANRILVPGLCLAAMALAVSCQNPATGKPEAQVREATPAPAHEAADAEPDAAAAGDRRRLVFSPDSKVSFVGSKVTGQHDGGFNTFDGQIEVVDNDPTRSQVTVNIDATSIWTDNERLTGHLKSPDFFDVEKFPKAQFTSTEIARDGDGYRITGNLDLHGVTKSVSFPAQIEMSPEQVKANAEFVIQRFDFGIVYPGKADDLIRDEVVVKLDLVAVPGA